MMYKDIVVDTSALEKEASEIENRANQARNQIIRMFNSMRHLDTMWDGPASEAYKAAFETDVELAMECYKEITEIINYVEFAKNKYEQCANNVESIVDSMKV